MVNGALDPVARAIGFHRVDLVVVSCPRLEAVYAHAENGIGMARVQPDWRFRRLAKILGIRTVMHHSVMLGRSPRVVGCPPDNRKIGVSPFNFWPLSDLDALSLFSSRGYLRARWRGVEEASHHHTHRQLQKQSVHGAKLFKLGGPRRPPCLHISFRHDPRICRLAFCTTE